MTGVLRLIRSLPVRQQLRCIVHPIRWRSSGDFTGQPGTSNAILDDASANATVSPMLQRLAKSFERESAAGKIVPVFKRALLHGDRPAIKDETGEFTYLQLYRAAKQLSFQLSNFCASGSSSKIAVFTGNATLYTVMQWACWFSGQVVVPLSPKSPSAQLSYFLLDSQALCIITDPEHEPLVKQLADTLGRPLIVVDHGLLHPDTPATAADTEIALEVSDGRMYIEGAQENAFYANAPAMVLYTSGSTGPPKGAVLTHRNVVAQTDSLAGAWLVRPSDVMLHVLPLNHIHGCVNGLVLPLSVGAKIVTHRRFDSSAVWSALLNVQQPSKDRISVFMAVPTIYALLIAEYEKVFAHNARMSEFIRSHCEKRIRLMVSGSAPLPAVTFQRWSEISGHRLLERYGMTETGMVLSNPYRVDRVRSRRAGRVGVPLPGAELKLVRADGQTVWYGKGEANRGWWSDHDLPAYERSASARGTGDDDIVGELYVKGANVFAEYLNRPDETMRAFANGWFRTGDVARFDGVGVQMLGRLSVDIIKTGGYKVSALEVETALMDHPDVQDVCVLGVPDLTWGQRVVAVLQPAVAVPDDVAADERQQRRLDDVQAFCKERLAAHQIPVEFKWVTAIPRNAMGKINKRSVLAEMFGVVDLLERAPSDQAVLRCEQSV